jgi:hypothetical protein
MLLGQTMWTQSLGQTTVTVNLQQAELPAVSVAQQFTIVVPTENGNGAGGLHTTVSSWQLSVASGKG